MEAERDFYMGDFENAEISAHEFYLRAMEGKDQNIVKVAEFVKLRVQFMIGDVSEITKMAELLQSKIISSHEYNSSHITELYENFLYVYMDQLDLVNERYNNSYLDSQHLNFPAIPFFNIGYGRGLLVNGEDLKLIGSFEYFFSIASVLPNMLAIIYTHIYIAAAYRNVFRDEEAMTSILNALDLAMPDQLNMAFVENCDFIKPLLEEVMATGRYQNEIQKILDLYEVYENKKKLVIEQYFELEKPVLTPRELEIAELAAFDATNTEIGESLSISTNTVKKALNSIYTKLSVNNRTLLKQYLEEHDL
jgi:LuxR family maltose regulon positive regulatory protein